MTTMKEGPGDDPFADDDEDQDDVDNQDSTPDPFEDEQTDEQPTESESTSTSVSTSEIPYVVRRQTVKEDRENEHVAFLRDEFSDLEEDVLGEVADELEMSRSQVRVTDLREAFVELGARHPEELAQILDEWGYEHLR